MSETKNAVKGFFAMFFCGFSTLNLFPESNYTKSIPLSAVCVTRESWKLTGAALKRAMDKKAGRFKQSEKKQNKNG